MSVQCFAKQVGGGGHRVRKRVPGRGRIYMSGMVISRSEEVSRHTLVQTSPVVHCPQRRRCRTPSKCVQRAKVCRKCSCSFAGSAGGKACSGKAERVKVNGVYNIVCSMEAEKREYTHESREREREGREWWRVNPAALSAAAESRDISHGDMSFLFMLNL